MPNEMNYIAVPESLKEQLAPEGQEGDAEITYQRVTENGVDYIKVTAVEGQPVNSEMESPMDKLKSKIGLPKPPMTAPTEEKELGM